MRTKEDIKVEILAKSFVRDLMQPSPVRKMFEGCFKADQKADENYKIYCDEIKALEVELNNMPPELADIVVEEECPHEPCLEHDLFDSKKIKDLVKIPGFAEELYAAMCNIIWVKDGYPDYEEKISWRGSGGVVACLVNPKGSYMDFYCAGNEGIVSERVEKYLKELGWTWKTYPKT